MDNQLLSLAMQYYLAARSAVFVGSVPVVGNLFHHAIEMLMKCFLVRHYSVVDLRDSFRHDLKKLWREFKRHSRAENMDRFDALISTLNLFESARYPDQNSGYSVAVDREKWSFRSGTRGPPTQGMKTYYVNLEEQDELFSALLGAIRVTPEWVRDMLLMSEAKQLYLRENRHSFI